MAKKSRNPVRPDQMKPEDVRTEIRGIFSQAEHAAEPAVNMIAELQTRRVKHLTGAVKKLEKELGKDHPDVLHLKEIEDRFAAKQTILAGHVTRLSRRPKVGENDWVVYGRVVDEKGQPAKGLLVRVFDRDRKLDERLGETKTDEFGDFYIVYSEEKFREDGDDLPDLYVLVTDRGGNHLYSSRNTVRFEASRAEYFEIQVNLSETTQTVKRPISRAKKDPSE